MALCRGGQSLFTPIPARDFQVTEPSDFATWQPAFADLGVPIFPVSLNKQPAVRGYLSLRVPQAKRYAMGRFGSYQAFGMACGPVSGVTVIDIDSPDEGLVIEAIARHGKTPLVVQTQSGGHHLYYRHDDEHRAMRPWNDRPIDQLGVGGFVVAPPSRGEKGTYRIVRGQLNDLNELPIMQNPFMGHAIPNPIFDDGLSEIHVRGTRNNTLFRAVMRDAHYCDRLSDVLDVAKTMNVGTFMEPLSDIEVGRLAASVWKYTSEGRNRIGQHGAWFTQKQTATLVTVPHLMALIAWLMGQNRPDSVGFLVADAMRDKYMPTWSREKFREVRSIAVKTGWLVRTRAPRPGHAAMYRWGPTRFGKRL